ALERLAGTEALDEAYGTDEAGQAGPLPMQQATDTPSLEPAPGSRQDEAPSRPAGGSPFGSFNDGLLRA
ncbi:MAG: hypothetical protein AAGE65_08205, partial [Planctomycetota bacterium]